MTVTTGHSNVRKVRVSKRGSLVSKISSSAIGWCPLGNT